MLLGNVLFICFSVFSLPKPILVISTVHLGHQSFHEVEIMVSSCIIRCRTKKPSQHQWFAIQCSWIIFYDIVQTLFPLGNSYLSHSGLRLGPLGFLSCFLEQTQKLWRESSASLSEHHATTRLPLASKLPIMPNFKFFRVSFYSS